MYKIYNNNHQTFTDSFDDAFATLREDGNVVTWGNQEPGGDTSPIDSLVVDVRMIYPSLTAFIAKRKNGSLVSWGSTRSQNQHKQDLNSSYLRYLIFDIHGKY